MSDPTRVLLWTDAPQAYLAAIDAAGLGPRVAVECIARNETPNQAQIAGTEAMLAMGAPPGLLPRMGKLRWLQALTAGVEGILALPDLPDGLTLTCARGTHRESMPENIMGALFYLTKPYAQIAEDNKEKRWARRMPEPLNGKTIGILGLGVIGADIARIAAALNMRVIGTRRTGGSVPGVEKVVPPERTDEILAESDYVIALLPATPATENFINAALLAKMKPTAWLLNYGRGHTIHDADLIAAVNEKRIAGAILDVFRQEPLPAEHPFWSTPGIMVLPHIGGPHPDRDRIVARLFVDNLARFLDGKPLRETVDRARGY